VARIVRSVIHHYFFPILSGDLVVEVQGNGISETLDARTLPTFVERSELVDRHDLGRLLKLAQWGLSRGDEDYVILKAPTPGSAPKLEEALFEPAALNLLRQKFDNEDPIALVVPVAIQRKGTQTFQHTRLHMYLQRDGSFERAEDHFIRQGITIADVHSLRTRESEPSSVSQTGTWPHFWAMPRTLPIRSGKGTIDSSRPHTTWLHRHWIS